MLSRIESLGGGGKGERREVRRVEMMQREGKGRGEGKRKRGKGKEIGRGKGGDKVGEEEESKNGGRR